MYLGGKQIKNIFLEIFFFFCFILIFKRTVQICDPSAQITNTQIFAFIAILVFKLSSRKVLFMNRKNKKLLKSRLLFKRIAHFMSK